MLKRIGLSSWRALLSASSPHGYQSTGLCACCSRYGLVSLLRRLVCLYSSDGDVIRLCSLLISSVVSVHCVSSIVLLYDIGSRIETRHIIFRDLLFTACKFISPSILTVSYTHLRAHETRHD